MLRAFALIAVIGRHMEICPPGTNQFLSNLTYLWQQGGWVGVDVFFVLSGFLISGLLFQEHQQHGDISFKTFLIRRGLKIYPPFLVLIIVTVVEKTWFEGGFSYGNLVRELLFLQNYGQGLWHHTWSLAVEEHFYLLLPIALTLLLKVKPAITKPFAGVPIAFVAIATFCLSLRFYTMAHPTFYSYHLAHLFPTHLRIDSLFCGVTISYFYHYYREQFQYYSKRYKRYLFPLALVLLAPAFVFTLETTPFICTYGLSLFWLGSGLLLFCLISSEPKPALIVDAISFIGLRSYSIYLWHSPVATWGIAWLRQAFGSAWNWYLYFGFYLLGSLLVGVIMYTIVEVPVLRFRDRLCPSRSRLVEKKILNR